jgi:alkaline phosphatase
MTRSPGPGPGDILTFSSGPGAQREKFQDLSRKAPNYKQPSLILNSSALHTGVDVLAWAAGPGASEVRGTLDNTEVALIIMRAMGLD